MIIDDTITNDVAKELFTLLSYCDNDLIDNIPKDLLEKITSLAADSSKEFYIDKDKDLSEQNISEDCKDLLSLIYYMYGSDTNSKDEILNAWIKNDNVSNI